MFGYAYYSYSDGYQLIFFRTVSFWLYKFIKRNGSQFKQNTVEDKRMILIDAKRRCNKVFLRVLTEAFIDDLHGL